MSRHRLRARRDRLEQAAIAALGKEPEKVAKAPNNDRQRFALLQERKLSGGALTEAEAAEFAELDEILRDQDYARLEYLASRKSRGITEAETAELARLRDFFGTEERGAKRMFSLLRKKERLRQNDQDSLTDAEENELTKLQTRLCDKTVNGCVIRFRIEHGFWH
jgi:hypothetical protein